ncbi:hypothetical protein [Chryseobacterium sp. MMS23-Vi53]|uniref:hypothetical protein n=1 Tax=Chryseobacterium sp. MMS23-Vi53 TaxID=3386644 RepID=UPI0039EB3FDB
MKILNKSISSSFKSFKPYLMKLSLLLIFLANFIFAQDLEIRIPDDFKEFPFSDMEYPPYKKIKICYDIINHSNEYYKIVIDSTGFSNVENEGVDELYLGLADFRIYENGILKERETGNLPYTRGTRKDPFPTNKELLQFKKKNKLKFKDIYDIRIFHQINKRTITLAPKETRSFCIDITLPFYNSPADDGATLYFEIENDKKYEYEIHLNIPKEMIQRFTDVMSGESKKYKVFSGEIVSNKVWFILKK